MPAGTAKMQTVNYLTRRSMVRHGALALVGGALLTRAGWIEASDLPLVRRINLWHPALPASFDGLRIVQISDVHAGLFMPSERLTRVRDLAEELRPDLIVFTGDQLDRREVDANLFVHGLAGIHAPLGVFGILGNHDHLAGAALATAAIEAIDATPLVNHTAVLERDGARIGLVGLDDLDSPDGADFASIGSTPADFRLVLCHQPRGWRRVRAAGGHVTLAGHTHGGQIAFPSQGVNLARLQGPYVAGPYLRPGAALYVSRGIGVGAVPLRLGAPPEIDLVTLRRGSLAAI
ncbi:MAG: metallophosphoesterase [Acidobacteria bacterium]|nr:metallophosphoesterase [Acidobacteriota bacterium]